MRSLLVLFICLVSFSAQASGEFGAKRIFDNIGNDIWFVVDLVFAGFAFYGIVLLAQGLIGFTSKHSPKPTTPKQNLVKMIAGSLLFAVSAVIIMINETADLNQPSVQYEVLGQ